MTVEALVESEGPIFRNEDAWYLHHCQLLPLLETCGVGGEEGGGGDVSGGGILEEQLLDAEAEAPEEVLMCSVAAAAGRRRALLLLVAAERGEENAGVAPGGGVVEARQQCPELAVGGVAGGLAPLQELIDDAIRLHHAHAAHRSIDRDHRVVWICSAARRFRMDEAGRRGSYI